MTSGADDIEVGPIDAIKAIQKMQFREADDWTEAVSLGENIIQLMWNETTVKEAFDTAKGDLMDFAVTVFSFGLQMGALLASDRFLKGRYNTERVAQGEHDADDSDPV